MAFRHRQIFRLSAAGALLCLAVTPLSPNAATYGDAGGGVAEFAPERAGLSIEHFITRGVANQGGSPWHLEGKRAVIRGSQADLQDARLTFITQNKEPVVITSPRFAFDRLTKSGHSDGPIHVDHRQLTLDGMGYDILTDSQVLHIRNQVRMRIITPQNLMDKDPLLKKFGRREAGTPKGKKDIIAP